MTIELRRPVPPAPVHPLAALATVALDSIFGVVEIFDPFLLLLTSLTVGSVGFITTAMVQRFLAKDAWGPSLAKGLALGILAGVPYPVTGTAVGLPLLAWAGLRQWVRLPAGKGKAALEKTEVNDEL
ncbi:MAG: hypothetical protein FJZ96_01145 [Chloroflexi bacterium]|nr:hypothetical protein [Chloroflexota bacterium]